MREIILKGWNPELNKVALSKLLRDKVGMSLGDAKGAVDSILDEQPVNIRIESDELAENILAEALELGAVGRLEKKHSPKPVLQAE